MNPSQSAVLMGIIIVFLLIVSGIIFLFVSSAKRTVKTNKKPSANLKTDSNRRVALTISLPIVTVLTFIVWLVASAATKEARYMHPNAFPVSTVLGDITVGLFLTSLVAAILYSLKK